MSSLFHNSSSRKVRSQLYVRYVLAVVLSALALSLLTSGPAQAVATPDTGRTDMAQVVSTTQTSNSKDAFSLQKDKQTTGDRAGLGQGRDSNTRGETTGGEVTGGGQDFQDVPTDNTFFAFLHNIYNAQIVSGYPCGGPGEPCGSPNLPYYRPSNFVTRSQMSKFVDLARRSPGIDIATATSLLPLSSSSDAPAGTGVYGTTAGNGIDRTINGVNAGVAGYAFGAGGPDGGSIGVVAYSSLDNGAWIGTGVLTDTYGLYVVQGGALIEAGQSAIGNSLYVDGPLTVTGPKTGYVTDIVRNVGSTDLHPGEIVTVGTEVGGPDQLGDIPVPGVLAASHSYDTGVMGVVDMLWVPADPSAPAGTSARTGGYASSAAVIHPGDYMGVVTLGLYKAVKVDATDSPIHIGDLLTSSNLPGVAVKAQDKLSAFGATIGKAMGNLESGIGTIPVLVTLK